MHDILIDVRSQLSTWKLFHCEVVNAFPVVTLTSVAAGEVTDVPPKSNAFVVRALASVSAIFSFASLLVSKIDHVFVV